MSLSLRLSATLLVALTASLCAGSAYAASPGNNGKIVFERSGQIVVQDLDGTQHVLTTGESPRWSPDGTRIAYSTTVSVRCKGVTGSGSVVRVMNADGTGQRTVTAASCGGKGFDPAWSPDGRRLVYVGPNVTFPAATDIYTVAATGGGSTRLTNSALMDEHPSWSSLNKIAWSSNFAGTGAHYRIWTMNADGTAQRRLSTGDVGSSGLFTFDEHHPDWSPDGLRVVFSSDRDQDFNSGTVEQTDQQNTEIYTMNADGTGIIRLTFNRPFDGTPDFTGIGDVNPAFSPDGRRILFESDRVEDGRNARYCCGPNSPWRLWRMNADGSRQTPFGSGIHGDWQASTAATASAAALTNFIVAHSGFVAGDEQGTGQVYLDDPAPAGGSRVLVASDNPAFTVPATVTVPAGATSTTFTIGTPANASKFGTLAHITVSQGTRSVTDTATKYGLPDIATPRLDRCVTSDLLCGFQTDPALDGNVAGVVNLDSLAPSTGADVTLTSSDPVHLKLPASVHVPARQDFIQFRVDETPVKVRTPVTVTATYKGVSRTFLHAVQPPPIVIGATPLLGGPTVTGGQSITATVNVPDPAPAGGTVVPIDNLQQAVAQTPASVTVPQGSTQTTFTIRTSTVTTSQRVGISARIPGRTVAGNAFLNVVPGTPPPPPPPDPVAMLALSFGPGSLTGGLPTTGTFEVTGPAPSGGFTVNLQSSDAALVSVPATVTVPAGSTSVTFTATTSIVATQTGVDVSASQSTSPVVTGHITLNPPSPQAPPAVTSLGLNPSIVTGGTASQGRITIESAAPVGGQSYDLSSANTAAATVPATVVVPAGATSATFPITTTTVTAQQIVSITAAAPGGASLSSDLTVNPASGPPPPPPPSNTDTVRVTRALYDSAKRELRVEATSTSSTATLRALNDGSGGVIGTLQNAGGGGYKGQFTNVANPGTVRVTSSLGGSATLAVSGASGTIHPAPAVNTASSANGLLPAAAKVLLHATSEVALPVADPADKTAPRLGAVRLLPNRIRIGSRRGTLVSFTVDEPSRVMLSFGRRAGRRFVAVRGGLQRTLPKGRVRVRFHGVLADGPLRPGIYRVTIDATDASGNRAASRRALVTLRPAVR